MDERAIHEKLEEVFRDVFDAPGLALDGEMTAADVDGWDSLTHINLIVASEKAFQVKFTTREVRALKNVGDFIRLIASKRGP